MPLLVAANRDEFFSRPTAGPVWLESPRQFWAGRDLRAGGTWLGANEFGLVAALLNRREDRPPDLQKRSRGTLVSAALLCSCAGDALRVLVDQDPEAFNLCTVLVADANDAFLLGNESSQWRVRALDPGLHVVTNRESETLECARHERMVGLLAPLVPVLERGNWSDCRGEIERALGDHGEDADARRDPLSVPCVHTEEYGTRSATIVVWRGDGTPQMEFWHAPGPPCSTPFAPLPRLPLRHAR